MFEVAIQELGDTTVFQCAGRITVETAGSLRSIVMRKQRSRTAVIDVAEISAIDAAGVGALLSLRHWANESGITLKLMNVTPRAERLLELTNLKPAFEVCSARETLELLCRAMNRSPSTEAAQSLQPAWAS
jgi:anti-sigma B factor antagonist